MIEIGQCETIGPEAWYSTRSSHHTSRPPDHHHDVNLKEFNSPCLVDSVIITPPFSLPALDLLLSLSTLTALLLPVLPVRFTTFFANCCCGGDAILVAICWGRTGVGWSLLNAVFLVIKPRFGEADLIRVCSGNGSRRDTVSGGCEALRVRRSGSREGLRRRAMVRYWLV